MSVFIYCHLNVVCVVDFIKDHVFYVFNRYELLTPGVIPKGFMDGRKAAEKMVLMQLVTDHFIIYETFSL